jgi:hypothetical protein
LPHSAEEYDVPSSWTEFIGEISASTATVAGVLLTVAALAHLALHWWIRRATRRDDTAAGDSPIDSRLGRWVSRGLTDILPVLVLMIWIQGGYLTLTLLLRQADSYTFVEPAAGAVNWAYRLAVVGAIFWLLSRIGRLIERFLVSLSTRTDSSWDDLLLPLAGKAVRRTLPLLALILGAPALSASPALVEVVRNATSLLLIGVVAFILFRIVGALAAFVLSQHRLDVSDNLRARSIYTQVMVLKKVAVTIIGIFTLASMLMVFDSVRQFGASILASAGIAGVVVGFAAQRSIATLLAGGRCLAGLGPAMRNPREDDRVHSSAVSGEPAAAACVVRGPERRVSRYSSRRLTHGGATRARRSTAASPPARPCAALPGSRPCRRPRGGAHGVRMPIG